MILGIAQSPALFHVDYSRRKLGPVARAHAIAKLVAVDLI